jgi:hypothetical protein
MRKAIGFKEFKTAYGNQYRTADAKGKTAIRKEIALKAREAAKLQKGESTANRIAIMRAAILRRTL